jgi:hypothetical protein
MVRNPPPTSADGNPSAQWYGPVTDAGARHMTAHVAVIVFAGVWMVGTWLLPARDRVVFACAGVVLVLLLASYAWSPGFMKDFQPIVGAEKRLRKKL